MTTSKSKYWIAESNKKDKFEDLYLMGMKLGTGSTCSVFSCAERTTGRQWAVKEHRNCALAEIAVLFTLNHPNVIRLKEVFENLSFIYIILELVTGEELFERIVAKGNYSERDAAECTMQILQGIKYLHDNDVVHRDLKPENLLYSDPSEHAVLKIADFGLAKIVPKESFLKTRCGTPGYCAPEILQRMEYSKAVDMWSIGVIIYVLLCGYEPFYDPMDANMYKKILKCDYEFHEKYWSGISSNAKDIIQRLLVLDPKKRLNAIQALNHPWVTGEAARRIPLHETQSCMKAFNARRKIQAVVAAVTAFKPLKLCLMTEEVRPTSSPTDTNNLSATSSESGSRSPLDATYNSNA